MKNMNTKVVLGVSGGVDSAVSAHLLKEMGYEPIGVYLYLQEHAQEGIEDARRVCDFLDIPFKVLEARDYFEKMVIGPFIEAYRRGETPNPCVNCNETVKFKLLLDEADRQGAGFVATGHYSRVEAGKRHLLRQGKDRTKDQSYMLYRLSQDQLSRLIFPLAELTKEEVRMVGERIDLPNYKKKDSQDICFIPSGDHLDFLKSKTSLSIGRFSYRGKDLGEHKGIEAYTVGQRRGLGISHSHPLYVKEIDDRTRRVYVDSEDRLYTREVYANSLNFIFKDLSVGEKLRLKGKVRYSQNSYPCTISLLEEDLLLAEFDEPLRAPTPGQSLVLYEEDYIFGGGIIKKPSKN